MNWENVQPEMPQDPRRSLQLRSAIVVSLGLHGLLLAVVIWSMEQGAQSRVAPLPETVRITLLSVPEPPQREALPVEPVNADDVEQVRTDDVEQMEAEQVRTDEIPNVASSAPVDSPVDQEPPVEFEGQLPQLAESPVIPDASGERVVTPALPDSMTLRQAVRAVRERQDRSGERLICTPAQRRNELFDCPDPSEPDYAGASRNPVYLSFNLSQENDQADRSMEFISSNQRRLRSGIQSLSLDGVDNQYLLEEMSQGVEVYSSTGNTRLERLTEQIFRNDPVYQQAKKIMNPR